jgi:hypothetical protein
MFENAKQWPIYLHPILTKTKQIQPKSRTGSKPMACIFVSICNMMNIPVRVLLDIWYDTLMLLKQWTESPRVPSVTEMEMKIVENLNSDRAEENYRQYMLHITL